MFRKKSFLTAILGLLCIAALSAQEMPLNPAGEAYEVHADSQGILWVSDYLAGEIRRIDPASSSYINYAVGGNPSDAHHDAATETLWWTDSSSNLVGSLVTTGNTITYWDIPGSSGLYGSGLDALGRLWITDFNLGLLYRLSASTNELCTYSLPLARTSDYLVIDDDYIWLAEWPFGQIDRLQVSTSTFTSWTLRDNAHPVGMLVDALGDLWWADPDRGEVARLDVSENRIYSYSQAAVQGPAMLTLFGNKVWFTSQSVFGLLDPSTALGSWVNRSPVTTPASVTCAPIAAGRTKKITKTTVPSSWTSTSYTQVVNQDGWQVYQLPDTGYGYGIAALEEIFVVDQGRKKLARVSVAVPSLQVGKSPNPGSVPESGGNVTFTLRVTNTSTNGTVTITSLADSLYGTLLGDSDCQVGTPLAAGASCDFAITRWVAGNFAGPSHVNTFTVHAEDASQNDLFAQVTAQVTFTDVLPAIQVTKTANPTVVPETGGNVTFTYTVQNTGTFEPVTLKTLTDSVFGSLAGDADCQVNSVLAVGASCSFSITRLVQGDFSGPDHTNVFTVTAQDNDGTTATHNDNATVDFTDSAPVIQVTKTANPTAVPETGGAVTFTFRVTPASAEAVTIQSLSDSVFGTLAGNGDCQVGTMIPAGAYCEFSITRQVSGDFSGPDHANLFTAIAKDNENTVVSANDGALVDFTNAAPSLQVTKTASPTTVPETGGNVTYTFTVQNTSSNESVTITSLSDSVFGTLEGDADCQVNTVLAAGASCQFSMVRLVKGDFSGPAHTNVFTAHAKDNENTDASDTDDAVVSFSNAAPTLQVTKTASPTTVPETGGNVTFTFTVQNTSPSEPLTINSLSDSVYGTLAGDADCHVNTLLAAGASCEFISTRLVQGDFNGPDHVNVFTAQAKDNENLAATDTDDAVVDFTDVAPTIQVTKTADPTSAPDGGVEVTFTFVVQNTSAQESVMITSLSDSVYETLAGDEDCRLNTVLAARASCQFSIVRLVSGSSAEPPHVNVFSALAADNEGNQASDTDDATVTFTGVGASITVTKTAGQSTIPESGGNVTFTFAVTNHSLEPATITALNDDKFGPLNGDADCHVGAVIPSGESCTFQALLHIPPGTAPGSHTNTFTATVSDGDGNSASASDSETVTYTAGPVLHFVYLPMVRR